jgi:hypothetical protein
MTSRRAFGFLIAFLVPLAIKVEASTLQITINIYNDAILQERALLKAQQEAARIFKKAGIEARLINCKTLKPGQTPDPSCLLPMSPTHLSLRIVPWKPPLEDSSFGVAFLSNSSTSTYSDVFYPLIDDLCRDFEANRSLVLGDVMAHEIGHLLLGHAHSLAGIMRPKWRSQELEQVAHGTLLFTADQARIIRARLIDTTPRELSEHTSLH